MNPFHCVIVGLAVIVSGCLSSQAGISQRENGDGAVSYGDGNPASAAFTEGNGSIVGGVRNDAGFPVPGLHVAILGTDHATKTNESGNFTFADLRPGDYRIRADGSDYYTAAEVPVGVVPNKVAHISITLMARAGLSGGDLPHGHDYWGDRTEVVVADADFKYNRWDADGSLYWTVVIKPLYETPFYRGAAPSRCTTPTSLAASEFFFNDDAQTVWPGTSKIEIKLNWNPSDAVNVNGLSVGWKHAADATNKYNLTNLIKNGDTVTIPVTPDMWDHGHQPFTFWRFWACLVGNDETGTNAARFFLGSFHVQMKLIRGMDPHLEAPHPKFWQNGDRVRVIEYSRNMSCTTTTTNDNQCYYGSYWGSTWGGGSRAKCCNHIWTIRPAGNKLIPPGTKTVEIVLAWDWNPASSLPLGLSYSANDVPPRVKDSMAAYKVLQPSDKSTNSRTYQLELKPGEADAFYQKVSRWQFLWSYEGEETDGKWLPRCVCDFKLRLTVDAIRDLEYGEI